MWRDKFTIAALSYTSDKSARLTMAGRNVLIFFIFIIVSLTSAGCSTKKIPNDFITTLNLPVSPTDKKTAPLTRWASQPEGKAWTKHAEQAVDKYGQSLLSVQPADGELFCKSYANLSQDNRRNFWVHMVSALAKYESSYNPKVTFDETTVDPNMITSQGKPIISRGLLQISKESANGYGCRISDPEELHEPEKNISCAVRILNRWVGRDKLISGREDGKWKGAARYFSPFRNETKLSSLQNQSQQQSFCQ